MATRNTLINVVGALVPTAVALATIPAYLSVIGATRYGVLTLAWLLLGYFGAFNLGLHRAVVNRVARAHGSPSEQQRVFWTAMAVTLVLGVVGAAVLLGVGALLTDRVLSLSTEIREEVAAGLVWLALAVPFLLLSSVCVGALEGVGRFGAVNAVEVTMTLVYQLAPLGIAALAGDDLEQLLAGAACAPVVALLLGLVACARLLPLTQRPRGDRRLVRPLLSFGGWVSVSGVVAPLLTIVDRFLIGAVSGARAVALYSVPANLVVRLIALPAGFARALFPTLSALPADAARRLAGQATAAAALVMTPVVVTALVLVDPFLRVWVGDEIASEGATVAEILLLSIWFNALALVPYTFLQARGRPDVPAKLHLAELPFYVVGLWIGLSLAGIQGAAVAWAARTAVDAVLLALVGGLQSLRDARVVVPLAIVATAYASALTVLDGAVARTLVGTALIAGALFWAWTARRPLSLFLRRLEATPS